MASLYKRGDWFWIAYYLNGEHVQESLGTKSEQIAKEKKKRLEYELAIGDLQRASRLPIRTGLDDVLNCPAGCPGAGGATRASQGAGSVHHVTCRLGPCLVIGCQTDGNSWASGRGEDPRHVLHKPLWEGLNPSKEFERISSNIFR
jgi:hypothetical protein